MNQHDKNTCHVIFVQARFYSFQMGIKILAHACALQVYMVHIDENIDNKNESYWQ